MAVTGAKSASEPKKEAKKNTEKIEKIPKTANKVKKTARKSSKTAETGKTTPKTAGKASTKAASKAATTRKATPKKKSPGRPRKTAEPDRKSILRESMRQQLWKQGANVEFLEDMIEDYINFYEVKEQLKADIRKRGVNYEEPAANTGKMILKSNPSVKDLATINRQMLNILRDLKLTAEQVDPSGDEEL